MPSTLQLAAHLVEPSAVYPATGSRGTLANHLDVASYPDTARTSAGRSSASAQRLAAASAFFGEDKLTGDALANTYAAMSGPPPAAGFGDGNDSPCMTCACERPKPPSAASKGTAETVVAESPHVQHHRYYPMPNPRLHPRRSAFLFFAGTLGGAAIAKQAIGAVSGAPGGDKKQSSGPSDEDDAPPEGSQESQSGAPSVSAQGDARAGVGGAPRGGVGINSESSN
eukprot:TRINITY_DN85306_c0_g1_i1.p1 TRINITY_DN85306_c0_g1~~TRINITY_DN85306_c0_g1_i1.p1  ORF type:complete len:226 (-),score=24.19 TRINITY_DN85306_c0_g1_i1:105-782(-)